MRRNVTRSETFVRAARRWLKKHPEDVDSLRKTLELLAADAFHPSLKTHKLKGDMAGSWSCSAGRNLRIVFEFVKHDNAEAILLQSIGTHDEVY